MVSNSNIIIGWARDHLKCYISSQLRSNEVSPAGFGFEDNYLQHNTLINSPNFKMRNLRDLNNFDRVICIHFDG